MTPAPSSPPALTSRHLCVRRALRHYLRQFRDGEEGRCWAGAAVALLERALCAWLDLA